MTLSTSPLTSLVISLATSVWTDMGCHYPKPVYLKSLLHAMRASRLLVHEHPLLILRINDKPISEHSPDFIVQDKDTLIVNLLVVSTITQADVNCVRACVNAHRGAAGGVLINFGDQRLTWMNIVQSHHNYYRSSV
ncbi:GxxExxY protein [Candidatus Villigracilis saccharophilus]|uniref:GxxExxY protein n=1 Tax=Candidatus Villigracilis saccharophilus TaxID=3140684 RepID=UPI003135E8D7|nr:GxxExxY protein [Anaerolineales bacterium]